MNVQLSIEKKNTYSSCVFTGHRELGNDFSVEQLKSKIEYLIKKGVKTFYTGMARGFDLIAAEMVIEFKKDYDITLIACIPYYGQEINFSERDKKRYTQILLNCDESVLITENYYKGCLLLRNRYMVDRADCMIAYLKKDSGGTAYTVNYFKRMKNGETVDLDNEMMDKVCEHLAEYFMNYLFQSINGKSSLNKFIFS